MDLSFKTGNYSHIEGMSNVMAKGKLDIEHQREAVYSQSRFYRIRFSCPQSRHHNFSFIYRLLFPEEGFNDAKKDFETLTKITVRNSPVAFCKGLVNPNEATMSADVILKYDHNHENYLYSTKLDASMRSRITIYNIILLINMPNKNL